MEVSHERNRGGRPIRPVILAGGAGTRLWPLSTAERPKHLLPLIGRAEPVRADARAVRRAFRAADHRRQPGPGGGASRHCRGGRANHPRADEARQRGGDRAGGRAGQRGRNTAGLPERPSHRRRRRFSPRPSHWRGPKQRPARSSPSGSSPTIPPPASAISPAGEGEGVRPVARFVEKPPLERAEQMLAEGGHYWNAGIFLASAATWREELLRHAPAILEAATEALEQGERDGQRDPCRRSRLRRIAGQVDRLCGDGAIRPGGGGAGIDGLVRHRQLAGAGRCVGQGRGGNVARRRCAGRSTATPT